MENKYGFINDGKVYLNAFLDFPEREIGKVLLTDEKAFVYFTDRFLLLINKIDKLELEMSESSNKGSFLMKIVHFRDSLKTYNALGDFPVLFNKLDELQEILLVDVEQNRLKNLELKEELLEKLQIIVSREDWCNDEDGIKELHQYWLRIGRVTEDREEDLEADFKRLLDNFFEEKRQAGTRQNELVYERLDRFRELIEEGRKLFYLRKYDANKKNFINIQREWKAVGSVPKDKFFKLNRDFQKLGNSYFDKLNEEVTYLSERSEEEFEELKLKQDINERSKAIYDLDANDGFVLIKALQDEWKATGFVPKKMDPMVFNEFYMNCEYAYEYHYFISKCEEKLGANSSNLQKTNILEDDLALAKRELDKLESKTEDYRKRRDDESRKFASDLMTKRRKFEAKALILKSLSVKMKF